MGLSVPTNKLTAQAVSASFDQLLYLDDLSGMTNAESTLKIVSAEASHSALQIAGELVLVKSIDTDQAAAFEVKQAGGSSLFTVNANNPSGSGVVINESSLDLDFRVESNGNANMLFVDGGADLVGIGTGSPSENLHVSGTGEQEIKVTSTDNDSVISIDSDTDEGQDSKLLFSSGGTDRGEIVYDHNATAASQKMQLKVGDNAVTAMTILGDGKIGVKTTSPNAILHVTSGDVSNAEYDSNAVAIFEGDEGIIQIVSDDDGSDGAGIILTNIVGADDLNHWALTHHGTSESNKFEIGYKDEDADAADVRNAVTPYLTVDTSGNVGVGNTSPGNQLEISKVSGAATLEISSWSADATEAHAGKIILSKSGIATVNTFGAGAHTTAGEILGRIEGWGATNDGDGSSDISKLSSYIEFANDAVSREGTVPGKIVFATAADSDDATPTVRMTLDDGGQLGIGTSAPGSLLEVRGPIGTGATSAGVLTLSTSEATVRVGSVDQLGRIDFQAPVEDGGTDAILVGASIYAECEEDFSSSNNSTGLVFSTGTTTAPIERMRIDRDGKVTSSFTTGTAAGGGIDAVSPTISVGNYNSEIVTTVYIDIGAGSIVSSAGDGDVIGEDGASDCSITKITTAINGLVYRGEIVCLEVPTTGNTDINLSSDTTTITEDTAGTDHTLVDSGGAWTLAETKEMTIPAGGIQDDYIYLTNGAGSSAGTYDAGKFLIRFYGASVTSL